MKKHDIALSICLIISSFSYSQQNANLQSPSQQKVDFFLSIVEDKFMFIDRMVLFTQGDNLRGYYGAAAQGESEYYLSGKRTADVFTGKAYSLYDGTATPFKIKVTANAVSGLSQLEKPIPRYRKDIFVDDANGDSYFGDRQLSIYLEPSKSSELLAESVKISNNGFRLLEIGKFDKDPEGSTYNIWYRITDGIVEGWVFGLFRPL